MTRFNTTIDDNSPVITYSPVEAWVYGQPSNDDYFDQYANGTFTLTGTIGATAEFTFYGTGVWIWGARRPNHGMYTVTVDGTKSEAFSGSRSDGSAEVDASGNQFGSLLYGKINLSLGMHDVVLTNEGAQDSAPSATFVDIDYITWETQVGSENSTVNTSTLDSSNFQLSGSGWRSAADNRELGTLRGLYTDVPGDALELIFQGDVISVILAMLVTDVCISTASHFLPFITYPSTTGDAVGVYGSTGQACGLFSVQIDGGISSIYNASTHKGFTNQLMFYGANLGPGQHTLRMTNSELSNGTLVVDHARVQRAVPEQSSASSSDSAANKGAGNGPSVALIGGICGAFASVIILVIGLFLWMRRRRRVLIISRKTDPSRFDQFDIDQPALAPQVSARQSLLSEILRGSMMSRGTRSDISRSTNRTGSSHGSESRLQSPKSLTPVPFILEKPERADKASRNVNVDANVQVPHAVHMHNNTRSMLRTPSPMLVPTAELPYNLTHGTASSTRLPRDITATAMGAGAGVGTGTGTSATPIINRPNKPHGGRKRSRERNEGHSHRRPHTPNKPIKKRRRPLPAIPSRSSASSEEHLASSISQFPLPSASSTTVPSSSAQQPHRSTSMMKGRRRSIRNSRIVRAGYNFFFAHPGSSNSGSAYAPTTVFTSEISERPTTTLSPVTEAPPPLPPSRSQSPLPPRPLQLVNKVD